MKSAMEMTFEELVSHVAGSLIVAIGKGDFRGEVARWCMWIDRGFQYQRQKEAMKPTEGA